MPRRGGGTGSLSLCHISGDAPSRSQLLSHTHTIPVLIYGCKRWLGLTTTSSYATQTHTKSNDTPYLTSGTVTELSAMLVDRMICRIIRCIHTKTGTCKWPIMSCERKKKQRKIKCRLPSCSQGQGPKTPHSAPPESQWSEEGIPAT